MNCYLCHNSIDGKGNNGDPVVKGDGLQYAVCDTCNNDIIIPMRMHRVKEAKKAVAKANPKPKIVKDKPKRTIMCDDCSSMLLNNIKSILPQDNV
jgi:ribosome-binding protein aMBF1 (putative translation factor)